MLQTHCQEEHRWRGSLAARALELLLVWIRLPRVHVVEFALQTPGYLKAKCMTVVAQPALDLAQTEVAQRVKRQRNVNVGTLDPRRQLRLAHTLVLGEPRLRKVDLLTVAWKSAPNAIFFIYRLNYYFLSCYNDARLFFFKRGNV